MKISFEEFKLLKASIVFPREIKIITDSMSPFIVSGDPVTIVELRDDISPITPIVFWQDEKLICHFFKKKKSISGVEYYITKPLSKNHEDPPVPVDNVLGVVVSPKIRKFKKIILRFIL